MKKIIYSALAVCVVVLSSCGLLSQNVSVIVPQAINTVNSVRLNELNLERSDYEILKSINAEASVVYNERFGEITIAEKENNEFSITFIRDNKTGVYYRTAFKGIARFGFMSNDYGSTSVNDICPENIVRNLAIYRLINLCKINGGDGVIEPIISTNVEQMGKDIVFKTTVSAKVIKLKTDK